MATKKAAAKKGKALGGAPAAPKPPKVSGVKNPTVAHVDDANGERIRTYTQEVHGDAFLDLAKEFAGKVEGRSVVAE